MKDQLSDIERYFRGDMNEEEEHAFLQTVEENPELKEEFEARKLIDEAIEEDIAQDIRDKVRVWNGDSPTLGRTIKRILPFAIAACLLGLIFYFMDFSQGTINHNQLAERYYDVDQTRSVESPKDMVEAAERVVSMRATDLYDHAIENLIQIKEGQTEFEESRYLLGHLYFLSGQYSKSVSSFETVIGLEGGFSDSAMWYLGLVYLKEGKQDQAIELFETVRDDPDNRYSGRARQILNEIEDQIGGIHFLLVPEESI